MSATELREREDFVIEATHLLRERLLMTPVFERLGWDAKVWTDWSQQTPFMRGFRQMMFSKIVPNLKRLGLLTPRVREAYAKLDLLQFEHDKDSVEDPEVTPPQELVELLMQHDAAHGVAGGQRRRRGAVAWARSAGQVAIVTGSSSGIGEATARRLAAEGVAVVVNSSSSVEAGERVAAELPNAIYVQASVAEEAQCTRLVDATLAALRPARHPDQQRRHDGGDPARRPRRRHRRDLPPHPRHQPARHLVSHAAPPCPTSSRAPPAWSSTSPRSPAFARPAARSRTRCRRRRSTT